MSLLTFSPEIAESANSNTIGLAFAITGSQLMDFALDISETPTRRVYNNRKNPKIFRYFSNPGQLYPKNTYTPTILSFTRAYTLDVITDTKQRRRFLEHMVLLDKI